MFSKLLINLFITLGHLMNKTFFNNYSATESTNSTHLNNYLSLDAKKQHSNMLLHTNGRDPAPKQTIVNLKPVSTSRNSVVIS
jgi:hypothetical protein